MDVLKALLARLSWRLVVYWGALALMLWGLAELTDEVYGREGGFFFDAPILTWLYQRLNPFTTELMRLVSVIGDVPFMLGLALLTVLLLWRVARREALFFALSLGGASLFMLIAKLVLARPRPELFPEVQLWETASTSFPSGHATGSMAYFLSLYLVVARLAPRWRGLAALVGVFMVGMISVSRLYLQVHYPSDILAGLALSAVWVSGANAFYLYQGRDRSRRTLLLSLSSEVVRALRERARERGEREDEVADAILRQHFALPPKALEPAARTPQQPETKERARKPGTPKS